MKPLTMLPATVPLCSSSRNLPIEDGVTEGTILIGASGSPKSFSGVQEKLGVNLYFQIINEQGGVHGRKFKYINYDDQDKQDLVLEKTKIMVERDKVFAILVDGSTPTSLTLMPYVTEKKVPFLFPHQGHHALLGKRYIFTSYPLYIYECNIMMKYLSQTRGFKKIGLIYADNSYGYIFRDKIKENSSRFGFTAVSLQAVKDKIPSSLVSQVEELKKHGAQALIMALYVEQAQLALNAKKELNWDDVLLISTGPLTDEEFLKVPGELGEGVIGLAFFHDPTTSELPGVVEWRTMLKRYYPGEKPNRYSLYGYLYAKLFVEGVKRAGQHLTREDFIDSMEGIKNWENGTIPPISFSASDHHAQKQALIVELKNRRFVPITGWIKVD